MIDVAIIGAGPAGLATAYHLERAGITTTILEETGRTGGRALSREVAGEDINLGAMFVYAGTPAQELAEELGVPLTPFHPDTLGIHVGDTTVVSRDNDDLVSRLPLPEASRQALRDFFAASSEVYFDNTDGGALAASEELGRITAQEQLDGLPEDVQEILVAAIRGGAVARPSQLSATYALRYFASYLVHEQHNRFVAAGGIQAIPNALRESLRASDLRTGQRVTNVEPTQQGWTVTATDPLGRTERLEARHVVMAVPAPRIPGIVALPAWKREALDHIATPGSTVLCVVADVSDSLADEQGVAYDDWSFVITPGRPFDAVINPQPGRGSGVAQFACYGNVSGWVPGANDRDSGVLEAWVDEFLAVAPGLRGRILGADIRSWEHCFSLLTPERDENLGQIQRSVEGTLHFAGDYSSASAGTHGAYGEAQRVAQEIAADLRP
jgi:monoamine oxidase